MQLSLPVSALKKKANSAAEKKERPKTCVIDPGGGLRGIYASGVFDYLIDHDIHFDLGIGVSAGAANICSYQAGQKRRNYAFYRDYSQRPEYMSAYNFLKKRSFFDMDYIYSTLSNTGGENPLNYERMMANPAGLKIVATNALTGRPAYFDKSDMEKDNYSMLKATCSLPVLCQPAYHRNIPFFDGACSDPVPVLKALDLGADRIVIILSQPETNAGNERLDRTAAKFLKKYPNTAASLKDSARRYNEGLEKIRQLQQEGRALIVSPSSCFGVQMISKDQKAMHQLYEAGYKDGAKVEEFLKKTADFL